MDKSEINLILAIRAIGLPRAKDIFSFVDAWENNSSDSPSDNWTPVRSKTLRQAEHIGNAVLNLAPKPKKRGPKPNPNSKLGRVRERVLGLLRENPNGILIMDMYPSLAMELGMSIAEFKANAYHIPRIIRSNGYWKLTPSDNT